nr:PREDICTED: synaptonemal complex protein 1 isoform X1 [Anolis carolinensis]|eukprot:XP_016848847.1 PREDICTED: synaptonemal complex protein 1 isoform X1 [Anolis carolinensis]
MDTVTELYSRLYKEAEKIKRWKVTVEYEVKEKERKLQENRKIIEALRKAIQELQFENERLSLKLEDEIHEHRDLLKESNTTRHFCDLLKERFMQSVEKSNKYEQEREETRQMYVDLNNNIEVIFNMQELSFFWVFYSALNTVCNLFLYRKCFMHKTIMCSVL